jgi:Asp-tRNA(Asn)/Glu-tRNA(Gln) amidotransferase A subunit family amidase
MPGSDLPGPLRSQKLVRTKQVSSRELVDGLVERIEKIDPELHGYLSYDRDQAIADAEKVDPNLPLGGVPIVIKDVISYWVHAQ